MNLYLIITCGLFFCVFLSFSSKNEVTNQDNKCVSHNTFLFKYISLLWIAFLAFLTGFRGREIGNDTITYIRNFNLVAQDGVNIDSHFEKGYLFFAYFISKISNDPHIYLLIHAALCYIGLSVYIFKYSKNVMASTSLMFCVCFSLYTNILRQGLAMILCLYAFELLKSNKKVLFIIVVVFASALHTSALICLLLLFCDYFPQKVKGITIACFISLILALSGVIIDFFIHNKIIYSSFAESQYANSGYIGVAYAIIRSAVLLAVYKYAFPTQNRIVYSEFFLVLILSCMGFSINMFTRLSQYFILPLIVEIPNAFYSKKLENHRGILVAICFFMHLYFIIICILRPQWNNLYPYVFWR